MFKKNFPTLTIISFRITSMMPVTYNIGTGPISIPPMDTRPRTLSEVTLSEVTQRPLPVLTSCSLSPLFTCN